MFAPSARASLCRVAVLLSTLAPGISVLCAQSAFSSRVPKTWNEAGLADWATPLAGINVRPAHMSVEQYYSLPEDNLKNTKASRPPNSSVHKTQE